MKLKIFATFIMLLLIQSVKSQDWETTGNLGTNFGLNYLGTIDNEGLTLRTNNVRRLGLYPNQTSTINGFNVNQEGFVLLTRDQSMWNTGPYSLLHLSGDLGGQQLSYRPWMVDGLTITGNGDAMYYGIREVDFDETESVLAWGDNASTGTFGADNLVFRFTRAYNAADPDDTDPSSMAGLQVMRLTANQNGRVGIGTTFANTAAFEPRAKLHVIDPSNSTQRQFRLSYDFDNQTDFYTDDLGNFTLNAFSTVGGVTNGGNVGINQYNPTHTLDVNGDARFRDLNSATGDVLFTRVEQTQAGDYDLNYLSFTGNEDEFLSGDGTWQTIDTGADCDWLEVGILIRINTT